MQILLLVALIVFLPVVFIAAVIPANEYAAQGLVALDCDGPFAVLIFAIPSSVVYSVGLVVFIFSYYKHRKIKYLFISLLCGFLLAVCTAKIIVALEYEMKQKNACNQSYATHEKMEALAILSYVVISNKNNMLHLIEAHS